MAAQTVFHEEARAPKVNGIHVYNGAGDRLGSIDNVIIGKRDGRVMSALSMPNRFHGYIFLVGGGSLRPNWEP